MDQLSTKKGWTAVTFLFHEVEGNDNRKRVFSHSYATRGKGDKLLNAIKDKFTTAMKRFMEGNIGHSQVLIIIDALLSGCNFEKVCFCMR